MGHGSGLVVLKVGKWGPGLCLSRDRQLGENKLSGLGRQRKEWRDRDRSPGGGALGPSQLFLISLLFTVCKEYLQTLCPWILGPQGDRWLHAHFTEMRELRPREVKTPIKKVL